MLVISSDNPNQLKQPQIPTHRNCPIRQSGVIPGMVTLTAQSELHDQGGLRYRVVSMTWYGGVFKSGSIKKYHLPSALRT